MTEEPTGKQQARSIEQTIHLEYLLFLPQDYHKHLGKEWPLILFLHGAGERGDDLALVKTHGIAKIVEEEPNFPFIAISPQCPENTRWWEYTRTLKAILDQVMAEFAVDEQRIYLTGLSMGGFGTWSLAMDYPDLFAAIAPICGGGLSDFVAVIKDVPVWAFHGAKDLAVPLQASQRMVDALRAVGGNVKFTVYPGVGHDSWTQTYENPELYEWFLQHSRADRLP
ncbi:MAG: prolyl oligopeptidase family serine peptidase [Anaerolineae bacterium]|jgi:predicted peptidase